MNETIRRAYETLDRLKDFEPSVADDDENKYWQVPEPAPVRHKPEPQAQDWSGWERWLDANLERALDDHAVRIAKLISAYDKKYVEPLRIEIASLRADLTIQSGIAKGEIAQLRKGKSDG